jgi:hypothetical protein
LMIGLAKMIVMIMTKKSVIHSQCSPCLRSQAKLLSVFRQPDCTLLDKKMGNIKCQFVHNRVENIHSSTRDANASWNYCPTACDSADLISRGSSLRKFLSSDSLILSPDRTSVASKEKRHGREIANQQQCFICL